MDADTVSPSERRHSGCNILRQKGPAWVGCPVRERYNSLFLPPEDIKWQQITMPWCDEERCEARE